MPNPFGNPVLLIREAAKSPMGVLSLMILLASLLAYYLFSQTGELVRLGAFLLVLCAFVMFVLAIARLRSDPLLDQMIPDIQSNSLGIATPANLANDLIRCSISGLIRIEVGGLFLLVKGHRLPHQYQPVGGVYKRHPPSFRHLASLGVREDDKMPIDLDSRDDLRVRVPGRNFQKFLEWFLSREGRELSPWREFYEELVESRILPTTPFRFIKYSYVRTETTGIQWSEYLQCNEVIISEIYELHPTPDQLAELQRIQAKPDRNYRWVTSEEIQSLGVSTANVAFIPPTAKWIL